ncbi:adenylate cyclase, terminal-differentiation specific-like isoform X2 [Drosophila ficusphila]|uniref:adenylate cyclase, terminal-differentiation specific-like isoform X2 n=1 Tax=Drosophila ficusphila TaxID=30025 RepID=UPI0007E6E658|nr:adenylate cyclase, terminal-differentiation specific-like isoform X2 [Drosophila ficusphila]
MARSPQQQLLQKQLQRQPAMSLPQAHPLMTQQQQMQHQMRLQVQQQQQQRQKQQLQRHLQQQYCFGQFSPQMGVVYDPRPWPPALGQDQRPSDPYGSYQFWYRPQTVNGPQVVPVNRGLPGMMHQPFQQQPNGASNQPRPAAKPLVRSATKSRSPTFKDQAPTQLARTLAGGRSNFRSEPGCLNRIDSLTESGSRSRDSEEEMIAFQRIAARTLPPEIESNKKQMQLQTENKLQEPITKEVELDASLTSETSSFFQRLAGFLRSRSSKKSKDKSSKYKNHDASAKPSKFSTTKKRGFFKRFFAEVRDRDVCQ